MPFPRSVLAYDGRKTRYDGHQERSHEYEIFAGQWPNQEWDAREFINNYNHIKRVEKK
jgi:hypothetical protein